jgi:hypothetical protein
VKRKALAVRLSGIFLLVVSVSISFFWFYWLAPIRHLHDSDWVKNHSMRQIWIEEQKQIHRTGVDHDSSISIGRFGDKAWAEWVIHRLNSSKQEEMVSCGNWPYHLDSAICDMTNQEMTNTIAWLDWWEKNKNKTQADWVREGFVQNGIILQQPLTTNNIITLLKLAYPSTNFTATTNKLSGELSSALRYNALRWLRDSGFRPNALFLKDAPDQNKDDLARALIRYAQWYGENYFYPGKLPIQNQRESDIYFGNPTSPSIVRMVYLLIFLLALSGFWLLRNKSS